MADFHTKTDRHVARVLIYFLTIVFLLVFDLLHAPNISPLDPTNYISFIIFGFMVGFFSFWPSKKLKSMLCGGMTGIVGLGFIGGVLYFFGIQILIKTQLYQLSFILYGIIALDTALFLAPSFRQAKEALILGVVGLLGFIVNSMLLSLSVTFGFPFYALGWLLLAITFIIVINKFIKQSRVATPKKIPVFGINVAHGLIVLCVLLALFVSMQTAERISPIVISLSDHGSYVWSSSSLVIRESGIVSFEKSRMEYVVYRREGRISQEEINRLVQSFYENGFFDLDKSYTIPDLYDASTTTLSITIGGKTTTVSEYAGGGPDNLHEIERSIYVIHKRLFPDLVFS